MSDVMVFDFVPWAATTRERWDLVTPNKRLVIGMRPMDIASLARAAAASQGAMVVERERLQLAVIAVFDQYIALFNGVQHTSAAEEAAFDVFKALGEHGLDLTTLLRWAVLPHVQQEALTGSMVVTRERLRDALYRIAAWTFDAKFSPDTIAGRVAIDGVLAALADEPAGEVGR